MQPGRNIIRRTLGLLSDSSARETTLSIIVLIIRALLPLVAVLLLRYFVDQVTGGAGSGAGSGIVEGSVGEGARSLIPGGTGPVSLLWIIAALAIALLADDLLSSAGSYITRRHAYLIEGHISSLIHNHAGSLGLRYFEDPLFHDRLERAARDISWRPAALVSDFILLLRGVISFIAMAVVLRSFGLIPLLILVAVFIPVLLVRARNSSRLWETRKKVTEDSRQASYFSWLLTGEKPAREVKLFDLGGYFVIVTSKKMSAKEALELYKSRDVSEKLFRGEGLEFVRIGNQAETSFHRPLGQRKQLKLAARHFLGNRQAGDRSDSQIHLHRFLDRLGAAQFHADIQRRRFNAMCA